MAIRIEPDKCDGCRRCIRACGYQAIELQDRKAVILDWCTYCGACVEACRNQAIVSDVQPRQVPDFSQWQGVWVFAEHRDGQLNPVTLELLGKARDLAADLGQDVSAVLVGHGVGPMITALRNHGADQVYLVEDPVFSTYRTEPYTCAIAHLIRTYRPAIVLMAATSLGRDMAPRVAKRVGAGLTADCTELTIDPDEKILRQTRPAFGGNVMATIVNRYSRPQMATVRPGVMTSCPSPGNKCRVIEQQIVVPPETIRTEVLETVGGDQQTVDLASAKVIVAGGRGVGSARGFDLLRKLAEIMGGEVAGTRVAVEQGWIDPENQVGQTGRTVRPEIYIACGISGAVQHRAGMIHSRYIIAINKDPAAPIFQVADWGIVADLFEVVPEMIQQLTGEA